MPRNDYRYRQFNQSVIKPMSNDYDDHLKSALYNFANAYTSTIVEDDFNANSTIVNWSCFECKKSIEVDASNLLHTNRKFNAKDLYCDVHRPPDHALAFKTNFVFTKYLHAFTTYVKNKIITNSKVNKELSWQDLQQSESTFQLIQLASQSSSTQKKKKLKKLSSFKSVLGKQQSQDQ